MARPVRYRGMLLLAVSTAASRLRTRSASGTQPAGRGFALRSALVSADMRGAKDVQLTQRVYRLRPERVKPGKLAFE